MEKLMPQIEFVVSVLFLDWKSAGQPCVSQRFSWSSRPYQLQVDRKVIIRQENGTNTCWWKSASTIVDLVKDKSKLDFMSFFYSRNPVERYPNKCSNSTEECSTCSLPLKWHNVILDLHTHGRADWQFSSKPGGPFLLGSLRTEQRHVMRKRRG